MAFGYEYLMVFLPEVCPSSFLLFVHNPAGSTKLRDYSSGTERQLGIGLSVATVTSQTEIGRTRFYYDPHVTNDTGVGYWSQVTQQLNRKWLPGESGNNRHVQPVRTSVQPSSTRDRPPQGGPDSRQVQTVRAAVQPSSTRNRALRGSRRQLQDYVNLELEALTQAVIRTLPPRLSELGATIRWVSPLAHADYQEYRDGDFLAAAGLADVRTQLFEFWPAMGPCWDALGVISDLRGRLKPGVILVEAKSHINEIYGSGCQAAGGSLEKIACALAETKQWLGVEGDPDWRGPLYQYANRLAHLYFLLKKVAKPAWLVNLYFLDDPIGPTSEPEWRSEIQKVKNSLVLTLQVPNAVDVFLPALSISAEGPDEALENSPEETAKPATAVIQTPTQASYRGAATSPGDSSLRSWAQEWMELANFSGSWLRNPDERISRLLSLWKEPVPGSWQRNVADMRDRLVAGRRYTRGDEANPRSGEHMIEHEILCEYFDEVTCLGDSKLIDGVNAFPLVRDSGGARNGNVEADLLLLVEGTQGYRLLISEVKHSSNNAWCAVIENLRQLKLVVSGEDACQIFRRRNPALNLPVYVPITGVVITPHDFFHHAGQKVNSMGAARELLTVLRNETDADLRLSVWDTQHRTIAAFD